MIMIKQKVCIFDLPQGILNHSSHNIFIVIFLSNVLFVLTKIKKDYAHTMVRT